MLYYYILYSLFTYVCEESKFDREQFRRGLGRGLELSIDKKTDIYNMYETYSTINKPSVLKSLDLISSDSIPDKDNHIKKPNIYFYKNDHDEIGRAHV